MERRDAEARRSDRPARTAAVVLCAPGEPPPRSLIDALSRRRVEPVLAGDPFRAMRVIAGCEDPPALIVVEPALHRSASTTDLIRTVRRRFPGVALWRFDPHARPPLRAMPPTMFADDHHAPGATPETPPGTAPGTAPGNAPAGRSNGRPAAPVLPKRSSPSGEPSLRLTAEDDDSPRDEAPPSALLSEEELNMLLSDDFDSPASR